MVFQCIESEKLYAKDSKLKREDVKILQEWLKKQPHLPEMNEVQVMIVLHSCYYRIEAAKITLDNYFTIKTVCPHVSEPLSKEALQRTARVVMVNFLPKDTQDGYVIFFVKLLDHQTENFNCGNIIKLIFMVSTLWAHQAGTKEGGIVVFDMEGFSFGHLTRLNIPVLRDALYYLQEGSPTRIVQIHVINAIPLLDKLLAVIKPFLKTEILKIMHTHVSNSERFFKYVPKEHLPEEYGGQIGSCRVLNDDNIRNLLASYDFFTWHETQKVDESKRVGKSKIGGGFGIEGTFKKLEID